ncbi:hypothetical protein CONCODRAFT_15895 [Conidiobolus coronatus NRRL 28638]|uniref:G-protein coupled receptors family 1 profile domain-containing protein n=1 Tax=Conidiobolus coronatus (strain ATCC 28846 / CBS 209.66 / NRRL 28638) TaxID=796925 RepID=A0A137PD07_CONC2|nr:hypothetical protein CONCODRAFT_15895 [Conidiobolus coronatus NRRL 28638]|eukprot:KXN72884.1 hypothetical protein CONCODRAFT_15895 [Conidiobolus coronatus NRRL 28638]
MKDENHSYNYGVDTSYNSSWGSSFITGEIFMFLFSSGGLLLNLLVLYILVARIRIVRIDAVLSGVITVMDLTATLSLMFRVMYKWISYGLGHGTNNFPFCKTTGTVFFASTISSFDIVSILGLIRCLVIVFKVRINSWLWGIILGILLGYNWIGGGIVNWSFTEISWGGFCTFKSKEVEFGEGGIFGLIISAKAIIMVAIFIVSYALIIRFYYRYYNKLGRSSTTDQSLINEISTQKATASLKLIGVVTSYIVVYCPKICLLIVYSFHFWQYKPILELITSIFLSMSSIINASVILFIQDETKIEWQLLMTLIFHRVKNLY